MRNHRKLIAAWLMWTAASASAQPAPVAQQAVEPSPAGASVPVSDLALATTQEDCLYCHAFQGLSRVEPTTGELRLFFCSPDYKTGWKGAHARLRCTACHVADEVTVIPHRPATPVDCTRACHINPPSGVQVKFTHQPIFERLEQSAHSTKSLQKLAFDPPLLRPGQSVCLYCHDEPIFQGVEEMSRPTGSGGLTERCDKCHLKGMPVETGYYASHVAARLQPARTVRQLAQICAVCHSDPAIMDQLDTHDTVASYLHSFHGKANLLGSTETATCLDCHSSGQGDVHAMLGKEHADSSISEAQLPNTCRTPQCHPGAAPAMSQAAVHLDLDPRARPVEFGVAAVFVILTAAVMSVFFLLIMLDLLNTAIRPHNRAHARQLRLAERVKEHPQAQQLLERMSVHQRFQHWVLAIVFILLVATGMPIKFADADWANSLTSLMGGLAAMRKLHRICGVILIVAFLYHLVYLGVAFVEKVRRARREGSRESIVRMLLDSPMLITPKDIRHFAQLFGYLLFIRKERPRFGHFNFMQKFEYWAVFWGVPIMGISGLVLWGAAGVSEYLPGRFLNFSFIIHSDESYLAFIYIAVVHIFSILLSPAVFPLARGTLTGDVPTEELVEGHMGELEVVAQQLGVTVPDEPPHRHTISDIFKGAAKRGYSLVLLCVCAALCFISLRFLASLLLAHEAAPTEIVEIPKRLDTEVLTASAFSSPGKASQTKPRGPLAHFHEIPKWFQPDSGNNCTLSGCHGPLPHGNRIEVRAFINMHATFVDCAVCHTADAAKGKTAAWFSLAHRLPREAPAVLQLTQAFESWGEGFADDPASVQEKLLPLLRQALQDSGGSEQLSDWVLRLETTYVGSQSWQTLVSEIRAYLYLHARGEYSAKIGLYEANRLLGTPTDAQAKAAQEYLKGQATLSQQQRESLLNTVHAGVSPAGALCTPCHATQPTLMDFAELGYPASRVQSLQSSPTVNMILGIEKGEPFHLPRMLD